MSLQLLDLLSVTSLRKSYLTPELETKTIIDIPEFTMSASSQIGLKGSSGSGKTTFLSMIAGLVKPDSGSILFDGVELTALSESKRDRLRASCLGFVYQSFNLMQGYTCLENVLLAMEFGVGRDRAYASKLLKRMELGHRLDYYPRQLSVGQQQRVAVARALANKPLMVLADEPTGNLDSCLASETLSLLRESCIDHKAALLLVSHDQRVLEAMPRVVDLAELNRATAIAVL